MDRGTQLEQEIRAWVRARGFQHLVVQFQRVEPDLDMGVVMEAELRPQDGAARAWIWLTEGGRLGLGVDRVGELAHLVGLSSQSPVFAAGHQPTLTTTDDLLVELDEVSRGVHFLIGWALYPRAKALALQPISGARFAWDKMDGMFLWPRRARSLDRAAWT